MKKENKNLNKFIINLLILLGIVVVLDRMAGSLLRHFYFTQTSGLNYRTTYAIDSTTADILVFGSSRANHHYVPHIFEDSLHMSFYNTGRDGNFLLFNYAVFKSIVKRYTPRIVIFDINLDEFYENSLDYDRISSLLPYAENHPEFKDIIEKKSHYEKLKLLSSVYPYNSLILTVAQGNYKKNFRKNGEINGYIPITGSLPSDILPDTIKSFTNKIDSNKLDIINDIILYCSIHNIKLYLVTSPVYEIIKKNSTLILISDNIKNKGTILLDYSNDLRFIKSPQFFKDINHLNEQGSEEFSSLLANKIKDLI